MALQDFSFKIPQEIIYGKGSLKKLPEIMKKAGVSNIFLVSDKGLDSIGVTNKVMDAITAGGYQVTKFVDLQANPTIGNVRNAIAKYKECGATSIIALGGGGPMDVAKAVGLLATYGGEITDYVGFGKVPGPIVPMIAIPTTAGTGSEVTASSVIVDDEKFKFAVIDYNLIPQFALLDPELIMTVPASIAAACGVDAFVHAEEAYVATTANPMTDAFAEKAMELIGANIRRFVARRDDVEAACNMMLGSTLAGIAFAWAKLGNVHAMSHPVSGFFGTPHGVANAILLPTIVEYNALADNGRYRKIYNYVTNGKKYGEGEGFRPEMLAEELKKLNADLGIPATLKDAGVTDEFLPNMVADAMKSGNILVNPRQTNAKNVEELYRKLL